MIAWIELYKETGRKERLLDGRLAIIGRLKKSRELDCEEILRLLHVSEAEIQKMKKKSPNLKTLYRINPCTMELKEKYMEAGRQEERKIIVALLVDDGRFNAKELARTLAITKGEVEKIEKVLEPEASKIPRKRTIEDFYFEIGYKEGQLEVFQERLQSVPAEMRRKERYEIVSDLFFDGNPDAEEFARFLELSYAQIIKIKRNLYSRTFST